MMNLMLDFSHSMWKGCKNWRNKITGDGRHLEEVLIREIPVVTRGTVI